MLFDINLDNSGEIIDWWGLDLPSDTPESDISDLYFSEHTGLLYVLFDSYDRLIEMDPENNGGCGRLLRHSNSW